MESDATRFRPGKPACSWTAAAFGRSWPLRVASLVLRENLFLFLKSSDQPERVNSTERKLHPRWNDTFPARSLDQFVLRLCDTKRRHYGTGGLRVSDDKVRFDEYVRDVLCPTLRKGDIVVWDNLPAHQSVVARKLVEATGATLMPLPSYSPDLNPIEMSFSKLKSILRKEKIREVDKLHEFLLASGKLFSSIECENYFRHAGYGL